MAILKHLRLYHSVISAIPRCWKASGICNKFFGIRADFLHEVKNSRSKSQPAQLCIQSWSCPNPSIGGIKKDIKQIEKFLLHDNELGPRYIYKFF